MVVCDGSEISCASYNFNWKVFPDGATGSWDYGANQCSTTDSTNCPIVSYDLLYTNGTVIDTSHDP